MKVLLLKFKSEALNINIEYELSFNVDSVIEKIKNYHEYENTKEISENELIDWFSNNLNKEEYFKIALPDTLIFIDRIVRIFEPSLKSVDIKNSDCSNANILYNIIHNGNIEDIKIIEK